jgi:uncharacterized protein
MINHGMTEDEFGKILGEVFSPARAITSIEFLKGRESNIKEISRAFTSPGRHAFIYGDRGVGKTSLALTSAQIHQSSDAEPICVSCDSETTLFSLVKDIATSALARQTFQFERTVNTVGFSFKFLSGSKQKEILSGKPPEIETMNECVDIIRMLPHFHSKSPVVVIDEFDRLKLKKTKRQFAEFLKKISDSQCDTKIIICGIASTLDELIDEHLSVARNLASIELKRLSHDGRWEIISDAAKRINVTVSKDMNIRIGQISDGFPHYVHLIGEKLLWAIYDDPEHINSAAKRHFDSGVSSAVKEAEALPRVAYQKATEKYTDDYMEVLWALADGPYLRRQTSDTYSKSYLPIMARRDGRNILDKTKFSNRLNRLKTESHGKILTPSGQGWYEYSDNIVRGYVRLKAQQENVEIGDGYFNAEDF